jgi:hypothetical protein
MTVLCCNVSRLSRFGILRASPVDFASDFACVGARTMHLAVGHVWTRPSLSLMAGT